MHAAAKVGYKVKRLCTICARGGSKGVRNKNIRDLLGKPLIAYSIEQAERTKLFDIIAVSSDSKEILNVAGQYGVQELVKRPSHIATDEAPKLPAIQHCVQTVEQNVSIQFDTIVDLDATSPLRYIEDIVGAVELLEKRNANIVLTGTPSRRSPYFNMVEESEDSVHLVLPPASLYARRQDTPPTYDLNASVYVWKRDWLFTSQTLFGKGSQLFVMPPERSIDIDSELDFTVVECLMKQRSEKVGPDNVQGTL